MCHKYAVSTHQAPEAQHENIYNGSLAFLLIMCWSHILGTFSSEVYKFFQKHNLFKRQTEGWRKQRHTFCSHPKSPQQLKPGARNSTRVSHKCGRIPSAWAVTCASQGVNDQQVLTRGGVEAWAAHSNTECRHSKDYLDCYDKCLLLCFMMFTIQVFWILSAIINAISYFFGSS